MIVDSEHWKVDGEDKVEYWTHQYSLVLTLSVEYVSKKQEKDWDEAS